MKRHFVPTVTIHGPHRFHPLAVEYLSEELASGFIIVNNQHAHGTFRFFLLSSCSKKDAEKRHINSPALAGLVGSIQEHGGKMRQNGKEVRHFASLFVDPLILIAFQHTVE